MSHSISISSEIVSLKPQRASLTRDCRACLRSAMACSSDASRIISAHLSLSGGSSKPISMAAFYPETGCSAEAQGFRTPGLAQSGSVREQSVQLRWMFMYAWYADSSLSCASIVSTRGRFRILGMRFSLAFSSTSGMASLSRTGLLAKTSPRSNRKARS
jgi:hypothetical protein